MAWTILYSVTTEGMLVMRTTSFHDAKEVKEDVDGKIVAMWGPEADYKIICMIKGINEVWLPDEVRYV
jgi:hypothetical protein